MIKRYYELQKGDRADHGNGEILIFQKVDGMYAMWISEKSGQIRIGNFWNYKLDKERNIWVSADAKIQPGFNDDDKYESELEYNSNR